MSGLAANIGRYVRTAISLIRHGVTLTTLLLWPLRLRRHHPWKQIDLTLEAN